MDQNFICPICKEIAEFSFSKKHQQYRCSECGGLCNDLPPHSEPTIEGVVVAPQTIFLSYAHKSERKEDFDISEELVWLIKDDLEQHGHQVWIDQEGIQSGSQWRERITTAILSHTHFFSFLSRRSVRDPGVCLNEIAIALGSGRQIQTLLTESEETVRLPLTISHLQWHYFKDWQDIKNGNKLGPHGETWDVWFKEKMSHLYKNLSDVQSVRVAGELQNLKDILDPRTFEAEIIRDVDGFFGRKWLFDQCNDWLNHSSNRVFWLKGGPGIGKSSFSAKLVHQANSAIVGFFKCDFQGNKSPEDSASECIRTLAYQLATRLPDYRMKLLYQQIIDKQKILSRTSDDLFTYLITEPLNLSGKIPEATRLAFVIDGLDEAGRSDGQNALADLIYKHADKLPPWLGIIMTSRPEKYLEQQFTRFETTEIMGNSAENALDLKDYLNSVLPEDLVEPNRSIMIQKMIEKSEGTFLYLRMILKDATIDLTNPANLPSGLDDIYSRDFKRYFPNNMVFDKDIEPFLRLLSSAPGPIPKELIGDILGIDERDIHIKVMQPLGSYLTEKNQAIQFIHKSVPDWLKDPKRSGVYQVRQSGEKLLGDFLWEEYLQFEDSKWSEYVLNWLPKLIPYTEHWNEYFDLNGFCDFLTDMGLYSPLNILREQQMTLADSEYGENSYTFAKALFSKGLTLNLNGKNQEAEEFYRRALNIVELILEKDDPFIADILVGLASALPKNSNEAESLILRALEINEAIYGYDQGPSAMAFNNLSNILRNKGELDQAEEYARRALDIYLNLYGPCQNAGISLHTLAIILQKKGDWFEAKKCYEDSISMLKKVLPSLNHPDLALVLDSFAYFLDQHNELEQAQIICKELIQMYESLYGQDDSKVSNAINLLGIVKQKMGYLDDAEMLYRRNLDFNLRAFGEESQMTAISMHNVADVMIEKKNYREASPILLKSMELIEKVFGVDHPVACQTREELLELEAKINQLEPK